MTKDKKSNFEVLEENRKAALSFVDNLPTKNDVDVRDKLKRAAEIVKMGGLTAAIRILDQIKDNKTSINELNLTLLTKSMNEFVFDVLGLKNKNSNGIKRN